MIDFREVKGDTANRNQNTDPEHQTVYGSLGRTQTKLKAFSERKQQALSLFVQDIDCQMRKKGNSEIRCQQWQKYSHTASQHSTRKKGVHKGPVWLFFSNRADNEKKQRQKVRPDGYWYN